jgi:acetyltransferase-like isoleucine patch superfamily enzyme
VRVLRAQRLRARQRARGGQIRLDRQRAIPRSGYDIDIDEGAWLATYVLVAGPVKIGAHAVIGGGSVVRKDVEAYAMVAAIQRDSSAT